MTFRLPDLSHRLAVIGRTGSGKTRFGSWVLSRAPFHVQPYVIVDYKREKLFDQIDYIQEIGYKDQPKHPGVYRLKPRPDEGAEMEAWLWKVWERGRTGLFFDEMYQLPDPMRGGALRAVFTQGRSKKIPVIGCTQRPKHISRFLFSEADFFATLHLSTKPDQLTVREYDEGYLADKLPEYHCRWYDVSRNYGTVLTPVPDDDVILETFDKRLTPKRRRL